MRNELTAQDIAQMKAELLEKRSRELPRLLEAVKEARAFGDLSENFEYKAAKQELNHCKRRIRYLESTISSAVIITDRSEEGEIGLFDRIRVRVPMLEQEMTYQIVTAVRANALNGLITRESPVGAALFGRHAGERVSVQVRPDFCYELEILAVEKQEDDGSIRINPY